MEFFYYWFHRVSHRVRWFWCAHVVHHSGETMNMSTAMRQSLTYTLNASHFFWVPLILFGFEPRWVMLALAVNLAYQYFVHTEAIRRLPDWFEFVFNTPSHHRAHHGRNREYIDKNYGGILIIFDRIFGTFEPEAAPVNYGIPKPVNSYNILTLNFHEWRAMFRDARQADSWRQRLGFLFMPPQWREKPSLSAKIQSE
ncbi:hypothetical protein CI610_01846 [invertebrate metagenome]|uniref:Fatty acid hydroxylase domain-containing protein n=1 Tax=invertebrate metagenome TaxID=1711999 RepID=A0A2H9T7J8_9ZZZZ